MRNSSSPSGLSLLFSQKSCSKHIFKLLIPEFQLRLESFPSECSYLLLPAWSFPPPFSSPTYPGITFGCPLSSLTLRKIIPSAPPEWIFLVFSHISIPLPALLLLEFLRCQTPFSRLIIPLSREPTIPESRQAARYSFYLIFFFFASMTFFIPHFFPRCFLFSLLSPSVLTMPLDHVLQTGIFPKGRN